jgi:hypothetical protein
MSTYTLPYTGAEVAARLTYVGNKNLLHNWDFRSPVNQRGQSSYTAAASSSVYSIDRWKLHGTVDGSSATLTVNNGYLSLATSGGMTCGFISQRMELAFTVNTVLTFSVGVVSGTCGIRILSTGFSVYNSATISTGIGYVTATVPAGQSFMVHIYPSAVGSSVDLWGVKLELGSVSTLASDPPADYGEELGKCLRYFERVGNKLEVCGFGNGLFKSSSEFLALLTYQPKRITGPTVTISNASQFRILIPGGAAAVNGVNFCDASNAYDRALISLSANGTSGHPGILQRIDSATNCCIDISADL